MAGSGSAQYGGGPTPWWTLPQSGGRSGQATLSNLQTNAPSGYEYDPVKMSYVRTPTSAGGRLNEFNQAAMPGLSSAISGLTSAAGNMGGGGAVGVGGGGPVQAGAGGGGAPELKMPDMQKANDATYATAKDQVGKAGRAAVTNMNDELGAQGMLGSGAQVQGTRDIMDSALGQLGQVSRDQAVTDANMGADFAKTGYAGNIAMRGQDINAQEANARLALESRQQYMQLLQSAMAGLGNASGGGGNSSLGSIIY